VPWYAPGVRPYQQYCGVARALDAIGDRWSLLVVRELLVRPCRYIDLRADLPGIATNMLADRLRALTAAGIIESVAPTAPVATALYRLTPRGRALAPVLRELARWSAPLMLAGPAGDEVRGHWLVIALEALYEGADLDDLVGTTVELAAEGEVLTVEVGSTGQLTVRLGPCPDPQVRVAGAAQAVIGVMTRRAGLDQLRVTGDVALLERLRGRFRPIPL
jgi:DNA-binding HxlR family transcriptional regulator